MTTLPGIVVYILIAALCGAIGRAIAGDAGRGFSLSFLVGFIGAIIGPMIAHFFKLPEPLMLTISGQTFGIMWAVVGSVVFVALVHLFSRR